EGPGAVLTAATLDEGGQQRGQLDLQLLPVGAHGVVAVAADEPGGGVDQLPGDRRGVEALLAPRVGGVAPVVGGPTGPAGERDGGRLRDVTVEVLQDLVDADLPVEDQ